MVPTRVAREVSGGASFRSDSFQAPWDLAVATAGAATPPLRPPFYRQPFPPPPTFHPFLCHPGIFPALPVGDAPLLWGFPQMGGLRGERGGGGGGGGWGGGGDWSVGGLPLCAYRP